MQTCDQHCNWCARNWWAWLKSREAAMSRSLDGGTSFASAAAVRPMKLEKGVPMQFRGQTVTVVSDSGFLGLDGRHWVCITWKGLDGTVWKMHVERGDLL